MTSYKFYYSIIYVLFALLLRYVYVSISFITFVYKTLYERNCLQKIQVFSLK